MIEMGKEYRTRDGREVRIYAVDGMTPYEVHGAYMDEGCWVNASWIKDGSYHASKEPFEHDLVEVKPRIKRDGWVNVYLARLGGAYPSKREAEQYRGENCIACIPITIDCEHGEGL